MVDPIAARVWLYRGAFVLLALAILFVRILPVGTAPGSWPGPDLTLCLMLAWVTRRPDYLPAPLIAAVVLVEDLVLMRPPGLWAAIVVMGTEFLRSRAPLTRELPFPAEWLMVGVVMLAMMIGYRTALALAFLDQAPFALAFAQTAMTILCYPLVTGLLHLALRLRKPSAGEVDAFGRRL